MSTAVATETRYTPEDLLAMPDGKSYELVDGQPVERKMGAESSRVGGKLFSRLDRFCEDQDLGTVWPADNGYQCFPHDRDMVRRPDVSFVKRGRLPGGLVPKGWVKIPPDLVVEVVSPNDRVYELDARLADYREVRVPLVWVINPEFRTATIYRADGSVQIVFEDDELSGEDVIPGFRCPLREILPPHQPDGETHNTADDPHGTA